MAKKLSRKWKIGDLRDRIIILMKSMLSLDYSPHMLALSSAVGTFIGVLPFYGFQTLMSIGVARLFRLPPLPILACIHVTNPLTFPLVYGGALKVGVLFLNVEINIDFSGLSIATLKEIGKEILIPLLFGCFIVGAVMALLTYIVVFWIAKKRGMNSIAKQKTDTDTVDAIKIDADEIDEVDAGSVKQTEPTAERLKALGVSDDDEC